MATFRSTGSSRRTRPVVRRTEGTSFLPIATGDAVNRPLKTSEMVARDIARDIVSSRLSTGDRLPLEAEMLTLYGVSRESLREALRLLEVQGLISLKRGPGGGPVVEHADPGNLGRTSTLYYQVVGGTYAELFDAWIDTESMLAERAAGHPDRELVRASMLPYLEPPSGRDDESLTEFAISHVDFHRVVASLAGNRVLEVLLQTVGQIVTHHIVANRDPREVAEVVEADHERVARAISAGHARKAEAVMRGHIEGVASFYRGVLGSQIDDVIDWR